MINTKMKRTDSPLRQITNEDYSVLANPACMKNLVTFALMLEGYAISEHGDDIAIHDELDGFGKKGKPTLPKNVIVTYQALKAELMKEEDDPSTSTGKSNKYSCILQPTDELKGKVFIRIPETDLLEAACAAIEIALPAEYTKRKQEHIIHNRRMRAEPIYCLNNSQGPYWGEIAPVLLNRPRWFFHEAAAALTGFDYAPAYDWECKADKSKQVINNHALGVANAPCLPGIYEQRVLEPFVDVVYTAVLNKGDKLKILNSEMMTGNPSDWQFEPIAFLKWCKRAGLRLSEQLLVKALLLESPSTAEKKTKDAGRDQQIKRVAPEAYRQAKLEKGTGRVKKADVVRKLLTMPEAEDATYERIYRLITKEDYISPKKLFAQKIA